MCIRDSGGTGEQAFGGTKERGNRLLGERRNGRTGYWGNGGMGEQAIGGTGYFEEKVFMPEKNIKYIVGGNRNIDGKMLP